MPWPIAAEAPTTPLITHADTEHVHVRTCSVSACVIRGVVGASAAIVE
jgi:hypothetical protein